MMTHVGVHHYLVRPVKGTEGTKADFYDPPLPCLHTYEAGDLVEGLSVMDRGEAYVLHLGCPVLHNEELVRCFAFEVVVNPRELWVTTPVVAEH